jgi:hypothetical protein
MSDDSNQTLFSTEPASGGSEPNYGAPKLKAWVTPKVITSTFVDDETASSVAAGGDAGTHS